MDHIRLAFFGCGGDIRTLPIASMAGALAKRPVPGCCRSLRNCGAIISCLLSARSHLRTLQSHRRLPRRGPNDCHSPRVEAGSGAVVFAVQITALPEGNRCDQPCLLARIPKMLNHFPLYRASRAGSRPSKRPSQSRFIRGAEDVRSEWVTPATGTIDSVAPPLGTNLSPNFATSCVGER
jgi:hypothetical protein